MGALIDSTGAFVPGEIERFSYKFLRVSLVFLNFARNFNQSYEKKTLFVFLTLVACQALVACQGDSSLDDTRKGDLSVVDSMSVFPNDTELEKAILANTGKDSRGFSVKQQIKGESIIPVRSASGEEEYLPYSALVPEEGFRSLLNERGEIMVGDTIYSINGKGTFYAHKRNYKQLMQIASAAELNEGVRIGEKLLRFGDVYLYETFKNADFSNDNEPESVEEGEENFPTSLTRGTNGAYGIPEPDFELFERERASRKTIVGKLLQSIAFRRGLTKEFPHNGKRRLNCAVFDYNYVLRHSIGITAKIQKSMWHGWAKVSHWGTGHLRVGYKNVVVRFDYPEMFTRLVNNWVLSQPKDPQFYDYRTFPTPIWFKDVKVPLRLPILRMDQSLSYQQVIEICGRDSKESYAQPIFAYDGIYIYYSFGGIVNDGNRNEITLRFSDGSNLSLGLSAKKTDPTAPMFKPAFFPSPERQTGDLLGGDFFACGYSSGAQEWVGYNLYW